MPILANRMRAGVERGEVQIDTWVTMVRNPDILMLLEAAGVDFARVDMEHTAASIEAIGHMASVARALDFPIVVRPPAANREWITRPLDVGVWNIHCPQVESAAHAAEIVAASRYASRGLRGNGGLSAATEYSTTGTTQAERRAFANREVFVTVMIKTGDAFKDLAPSFPRTVAPDKAMVDGIVAFVDETLPNKLDPATVQAAWADEYAVRALAIMPGRR